MAILTAVSGLMFTVFEAKGQDAPTVPQSEASATVEASRLLASVDAHLSVVEQANAGPLLLERLRLLYFLGVDQDEYLTLAEAQIDRMRQDGLGTGAVIEGFEAAVEVVRGKHAFWPHQKIGHVRGGLSRLDELVSDHPSEVEVRYLRLMSCFYLPFFFSRGETVKDDFSALGGLLAKGRGTLSRRAFAAVGEFVLEEGGLGKTVRAELRRALDRSAKDPETLFTFPEVRRPSDSVGRVQ